MTQSTQTLVPASPPKAESARGRHWGDSVFRGVLTFFGLVVLFVPGLIVLELVHAAGPSLASHGLGFITSTFWDPVRLQFGALPFIYGTIVSSLLALVIALPVSLFAAIFLSELAPTRLRAPLSFLVELLASIPSVVYGFWAIAVLIPWLRTDVEPFLQRHFGMLPFFRGEPIGFGLLAAGIVLAIMIAPTIIAISREVLQAVPRIHREAAIGLGATPWDTIRFAVLPSAKSGIVGATILGFNRALGETMAVTMVIGNRPAITKSLFDPAYSMASVLANEFREADSTAYLSALSEIALLLFGVALILNLFARFLVITTRGKLVRT